MIFNPHPNIQTLRLADGASCIIIDDALMNPEQLINYATTHFNAFSLPTANAYPGIELAAPLEIYSALNDFFRIHIRHLLNGRRLLDSQSRFSIMTLLPAQLRPRQWICHRDRFISEPDLTIAASVLYLFKDSAFGGTSFYRSKINSHETEQLISDSVNLSAKAFSKKYAIEQNYLTASNDYFELIGQVEAKWNRIIFYDGSIFHSSSYCAPEKIKADPLAGRLTLNGFFTCRKNAF